MVWSREAIVAADRPVGRRCPAGGSPAVRPGDRHSTGRGWPTVGQPGERDRRYTRPRCRRPRPLSGRPGRRPTRYLRSAPPVLDRPQRRCRSQRTRPAERPAPTPLPLLVFPPEEHLESGGGELPWGRGWHKARKPYSGRRPPARRRRAPPTPGREQRGSTAATSGAGGAGGVGLARARPPRVASGRTARGGPAIPAWPGPREAVAAGASPWLRGRRRLPAGPRPRGGPGLPCQSRPAVRWPPRRPPRSADAPSRWSRRRTASPPATGRVGRRKSAPTSGPRRGWPGSGRGAGRVPPAPQWSRGRDAPGTPPPDARSPRPGCAPPAAPPGQLAG